MNKKIIAFISFLLMSTTPLFAWDGAVTGKVGVMQVTHGENYGFRVHLTSGQQLCGNAHNWAYVNNSDSNYNTYVGVLLTAKTAQHTVTIYSNQKGSNGYCHIGHVTVH